MIPPVVGRVVWYYPLTHQGEQPLAAQIAYVHSATHVNLGYLHSNGAHAYQTSVRLVQEDDTPPTNENYCTWMPYQIGQSKRSGSGVPASFDPKER